MQEGFDYTLSPLLSATCRGLLKCILEQKIDPHFFSLKTTKDKITG